MNQSQQGMDSAMSGTQTPSKAGVEDRDNLSLLDKLSAKAEAQLAYWRERMRAEKCLEDGISDDGEVYTPIGDAAAWEGGYCNGRMGEAEWWIGTLRSLAISPDKTGEGSL